VQVNGIRLANITNLELTHGKRTWQVRGEERSTQIQHWIWEEERVRVGQDGQPVLDSQKKFVKDRVRLERPKVITAAVFNAEQIGFKSSPTRRKKSYTRRRMPNGSVNTFLQSNKKRSYNIPRRLG
jgi:antirestriction protein ArdC